MAKESNGSTHHRIPLTINQEHADTLFKELVGNISSIRQLWNQGRGFDTRRNYAEECGYPPIVSSQQYRDLYDREPIAARVVELLPKQCWKVSPEVWETDNADSETQFEKDLIEVGASLRGGSKFQSQEHNPLWEYCRRVDVVSGIGQYGIMLLGLDDENGGDLSKPAEPRKGQKLLYMRCFSDELAQVTKLEQDPTSPRYGQPVSYNITFNDPREGTGLAGGTSGTWNVHWSRVIHVADNHHQAASSEIFAAPRMRPVLNRLIDLNKLYGGSAEMYWKGAFPGISIETQPGMGGEVKVDKDQLRNMVDSYQNSLQRYLALFGLTARSLSPQVVDPSQQIEVQLVAICVKLGCPKRKFMGSERGELASAQDEGGWNDVLRERQNGYITPRIICQIIDRLIYLKVLTEPKQYHVEWPAMDLSTAQEKASIAMQRTQAMGAYVSMGVEALLPPQEFLTREMHYSVKEAQTILGEAETSRADPITGGLRQTDAAIAMQDTGVETQKISQGMMQTQADMLKDQQAQAAQAAQAGAMSPVGNAIRIDEVVAANCGGKGSKRPGPCPGTKRKTKTKEPTLKTKTKGDTAKTPAKPTTKEDAFAAFQRKRNEESLAKALAEKAKADKKASEDAKIKADADAKVKAELSKPGHASVVLMRQSLANNSNLTNDQKLAYSKAIDSATSKMPKAALDRIAANLKQATFHASREELSAKVFGAADIARSGVTNGTYHSGTGVMNLDGDVPRLGKYGKDDLVGKERSNAHETYAHELTHAIDGIGFSLSKSAEWKAAFGKEINTPKASISKYATTHPAEGFAEFGRMLYGAKISRGYLEKNFPACTAFYKKQGLWP